jgi:hypothetical protein
VTDANIINVDLDSLLGEHILDAVDTYVEKVKTWGDHFENAECIRFRLDGVVYIAVSNPDDGYRSSMDQLFVSPSDEVHNVFPPIKVVATKQPNDDEWGTVNDVLMLTDVVTDKVVMEVGTTNTDDYYPGFVSSFSPENMVTNIGAAP